MHVINHHCVTKLLVFNRYYNLALSMWCHGADAVQLTVVAMALGNSWKSYLIAL